MTIDNPAADQQLASINRDSTAGLTAPVRLSRLKRLVQLPVHRWKRHHSPNHRLTYRIGCSLASRRPAAANVKLILIGAVACSLLVGIVWLTGLADRSDSNTLREGGNSIERAAPPTPGAIASGSRQTAFDDQAKLTAEFVTANGRAKLELLNRFVDPKQTDWQTEVFSEAANSQLALLSDLLTKPRVITAAALPSLVTDDFSCTGLRPRPLDEALRDSSIVVRRFRAAAEGTKSVDRAAESFRGSEGAAVALREFSTVFHSDPTPNIKLKIYRVEQHKQSMATAVAVEIGTTTSSGAVQINATWKCNWNESRDHPPRLASIEVQDYEEIASTAKEHRWFVDCTEAVLGHNPSFQDQLRYGIDTWVNRLDRRLTISRFGHHGIAVGDVNGDCRDDIYVCQPGGLPNQLFVQQADGLANEISSVAAVDFLDHTYSAILADLDNDGDQDLIVAAIAALTVLENDGHGTFEPVAVLTQCPTANSLAVADYDGDGLLDIYACRYRGNSLELGQFPLPVPYYDANNGGRNYLFRNIGNGIFTDVTTETGLDADNSRFSYAAAWEDYDNDGDQDLYVVNDFGRNCLYRNNGGQFDNVASEAGVEDIASGMSASWSDFDHDGHMDLYVSNMFSSAGNRITYQTKLAESFSESARAQIQRHARGNTLFRNLGSGAFRDVSVPAQVTMGRWAWASLFADINNDSWSDLLVLNGLFSTDDTGDL